MKKFILLLTVLLFSANINLFSQWEPPCDLGDCTGDWQERTDEVTIQDCIYFPYCKVIVHSHYRLATCPNQTPSQRYEFHIDYFEPNYACEVCYYPPNDTVFARKVIRDFILKLAQELQNAPLVQISFASCWSFDLFGPFPRAQPCPNNTSCCRKFYEIEDGYVWLVGDDDDPASCTNWEGHECRYFCDPNGFLYKRTLLDEDLTELLTSETIPNPNIGTFEISLSGLIRGHLFVEIRDLSGKLILQKEIDKDEFEVKLHLDFQNIQNGSYQYIVSKDDHVLTSGKFIINK